MLKKKKQKFLYNILNMADFGAKQHLLAEGDGGGEGAGAGASSGGSSEGGKAAGASDKGGEGAGAGTGSKVWYEGADAEIVGHIQTKGWDDPVKAAKAHRELEKLMGSKNAIELPGDDAKPEDIAKFYTKLGRPESAEKYEFKPEEGVKINKDFENGFRKWAHDAGLSQKQAQALYNNYNSFAKGLMADGSATMTKMTNDGKAALTKDWGAEYGNKVEAARRALDQFGVKNVTTDDLLINPGLMKIVAEAGQKFLEADFVGGGNNSGFGMTPEQAVARKNELLSDAKWKAEYLSGDREKIKIINNLTELAAGGKKVKV